ncbi:replication protein a-related [Anaeramoeba flamelloides]|uniref:Replication protein a-related n=1 Tax=Anaeramoeba flamelloides TaxID=1746091 RepID=A0ABQ8XXE9_9EUKA|nr:replication protein a-related [Anaeramoeba flamelloides]
MFASSSMPLFYESPNKTGNLKNNTSEEVQWEWTKKQNLRSVTIKQIDKCCLSDNDRYILDGYVLERVLIVANITSIERKTTYTSYIITDGTSSITAIDFDKKRLKEFEKSNQQSQRNQKTKNNSNHTIDILNQTQDLNHKIKIYAEIQNYLNEKKLFIEELFQIHDHNEISFHFLQVIQQHLFFQNRLQSQFLNKMGKFRDQNNETFYDLTDNKQDSYVFKTPKKSTKTVLELRRDKQNSLLSRISHQKLKKKSKLSQISPIQNLQKKDKTQSVNTNMNLNKNRNTAVITKMATNNNNNNGNDYNRNTIKSINIHQNTPNYNDNFLQKLVINTLNGKKYKSGLMIEEIAKELQSDPSLIEYSLQILHQKNQVYFETNTNLWKTFC